MKRLIVFFFTLAIYLFSLSFTKSVLASDLPILESPPLGSSTIDTSPTLTWSWTGSCFVTNCFEVQVDNQSDFSSPEKDYSTSNTFYSPQLSVSTWYWRIKAKNIDGVWSDWSNGGNFLIVENISPSPSPTSSLSPTVTPIPTSSPTPINTPTVNNYDYIYISEYMAYPESGDEWVELYNDNNFEVNLNGWYLDDIVDGGSSPKSISGIISAHNYKQFFLSSSFLNNDGDDVRFLNGSKDEKDSTSFELSTKGKSWSRDGNGDWCQVDPTPNSSNPDCPTQTLSITSSLTLIPTPTVTPTKKPTITPTPKITPTSESEFVLAAATTLTPTTPPAVTSTAQENKSSINLFPVILIGAGMLFLTVSGVLLFKTSRERYT